MKQLQPNNLNEYILHIVRKDYLKPSFETKYNLKEGCYLSSDYLLKKSDIKEVKGYFDNKAIPHKNYIEYFDLNKIMYLYVIVDDNNQIAYKVITNNLSKKDIIIEKQATGAIKTTLLQMFIPKTPKYYQWLIKFIQDLPNHIKVV